MDATTGIVWIETNRVGSNMYEGTFLSARNSMICTGGVFNSFTKMYSVDTKEDCHVWQHHQRPKQLALSKNSQNWSITSAKCGHSDHVVPARKESPLVRWGLNWDATGQVCFFSPQDFSRCPKGPWAPFLSV